MRIRLLVVAIFLVLMLTASALGVLNTNKENVSINATNASVSAEKASLTIGNDTKNLMTQTWDARVFAFVIVVLIIFSLIPYTLNLWQSHNHLTKVQESLCTFINTNADKIEDDKLVQIIQELIRAKPMAAPGIARGVMALTITMIVGVALFFLFAYPNMNPATNQSIKEILLALTGALTAIVGFYFGGKASEPKPAETKPTGTIQPKTEKPPKEPKPKKYKVIEDFDYDNIKYKKGTTVDLAKIPDEKLKEFVETNKIEIYVGEDEKEKGKKLAEEIKGKPGWFMIKVNFRHNYDYYFAGNPMNLTGVPTEIVATWMKKKWIEPYEGPTA
jgi:hypothetical protein